MLRGHTSKSHGSLTICCSFYTVHSGSPPTHPPVHMGVYHLSFLTELQAPLVLLAVAMSPGLGAGSKS